MLSKSTTHPRLFHLFSSSLWHRIQQTGIQKELWAQNWEFFSGIFGFFSLGKGAVEEATFPVPGKYRDIETFLPLAMKQKERKISKTLWNHKPVGKMTWILWNFILIIRDSSKIPVYPNYIRFKFQEEGYLGAKDEIYLLMEKEKNIDLSFRIFLVWKTLPKPTWSGKKYGYGQIGIQQEK